MYKAQEPDLFLRSNRAALYRGVELMSASRMLVGIALVTQLDRNKASLYLNSLIFTTNWTVLPFFFWKEGGLGAVEQGEKKGRKGKGRGWYVWNRGLPTSRHYPIIPQQTPASNLQPPGPLGRAAAAGPASGRRETGQWNVRIIIVAQAAPRSSSYVNVSIICLTFRGFITEL